MMTKDLNFLFVLEALGKERSVSKAAQRLGLTQPAVSHALGKLRTMFHDDLFVRAGTEMAPTPLGERLIQGVEHVLAVVEEDIWSSVAFDPLTTRRTFSVCMSDMGVIVLLPKLLAAVKQEAPYATLKPIQLPSLNLAAALQNGEVDLAIGYLGKLGNSLYQQPLFERSLVGIIRGGKSRKRVSLSLEQFVEAEHAVCAGLAITNQLIEKELRRHGARLRVGVEVPYLLAVPSLVAVTDLVAAVPNELAELFSKMADVDVFPLPIDLPDLTVQQFWHARHQNDAGHRWFRSLVVKTLGQERKIRR